MADIFVYCPKLSNGARDLAKALGAKRLRNFDGMTFWDKGKPLTIPSGSVIVNWGAKLPEMDDVRVLNSTEQKTFGKYAEHMRWMDHGIRVPTVWHGSAKPGHHDGMWLPRRTYHTPCEDLLKPPTGWATFWTLKLELIREFRVHVFNGRMIKSGQKQLRPGYVLATSHENWVERHETEKVAHPWWRHFDTGWTVNYTDFSADPVMRKLAASAVKALSLTFAAVDIGQTKEGTSYVLSIGRAPSLDDVTAPRYARLIQKWIDAPLESEKDEPEASLKGVSNWEEGGGYAVDEQASISMPATEGIPPSTAQVTISNAAYRNFTSGVAARRAAKKLAIDRDARDRAILTGAPVPSGFASAGSNYYYRTIREPAPAPPPPEPPPLSDPLQALGDISLDDIGRFMRAAAALEGEGSR